MMKLQIITSFLLLSTFASCQDQKKQVSSKSIPEQSNSLIQEHQVYELPKVLNEISGITFLPEKKGLIYIIQDEAGSLFTYDLQSSTIVAQYDFAPAGDYEEVCNDGRYFYVLRSDGSIYSFPVSLDAKPAEVQVFEGMLGKGEYESMAYDSKNHSLHVICKSCKQDRKSDRLSGYEIAIHDHGKLTMKGNLSIAMDEISQLEGERITSFNPSSLVKRTSSNEWYLLSSIDKMLLILDADYKPKRYIRFEKNQFSQPEGIAFDQEDQLYISSEKNKAKHAMLYQVRIQP